MLEAYPRLTKEDIQAEAALRYAADALAHEEVVIFADGQRWRRSLVRLIAGESCDFSIVIGLRAAGYDVKSITETMSGTGDETVIALASSERRLLLTEDKDFGQLVFSAAKDNSGVILIRYPLSARSTLAVR